MVGIIAGPDGPTAIYAAGGNTAAILAFAAAAALAVAAGIWFFRHGKGK